MLKHAVALDEELIDVIRVLFDCCGVLAIGRSLFTDDVLDPWEQMNFQTLEEILKDT